jgi:hypothetical protein
MDRIGSHSSIPDLNMASRWRANLLSLRCFLCENKYMFKGHPTRNCRYRLWYVLTCRMLAEHSDSDLRNTALLERAMTGQTTALDCDVLRRLRTRIRTCCTSLSFTALFSHPFHASAPPLAKYRRTVIMASCGSSGPSICMSANLL